MKPRKIEQTNNRISIPSKLRKEMNISIDQPLEISIEYGLLCVQPFNGEKIHERPFVGIVRLLDNNGRITIPSEYLEVLDYSPNDRFEVFAQNEKIIIKKI